MRPMSLDELLGQAEVWHSRQGHEMVEYRLTAMDSAHLANLRSWLLRSAPQLHSSALSSLYGMGKLVSGELALLDLDRSIDQLEAMSPEAWMAEQPLFEKITEILAGRIEDTHGKDS